MNFGNSWKRAVLLKKLMEMRDGLKVGRNGKASGYIDLLVHKK